MATFKKNVDCSQFRTYMLLEIIAASVSVRLYPIFISQRTHGIPDTYPQLTQQFQFERDSNARSRYIYIKKRTWTVRWRRRDFWKHSQVLSSGFHKLFECIRAARTLARCCVFVIYWKRLTSPLGASMLKIHFVRSTDMRILDVEVQAARPTGKGGR